MVAAVLTGDLLLPKGAAAPSCMDDRPLPADPVRRPASMADGRSGAATAAGAQLVVSGDRASTKSQRAERARMSVRLDPQRHRRLRILAAHLQTHIQDILIEAIDDYVAKVSPDLGPETCQCLADDAGPPAG